MTSVIAVIILAALCLAALAIPVLIGVYVYRDAGKRGMNTVLWTVISVLAPGFIGFIIYLIARSDHTGILCGACGKPVMESYANCPYCGASLKERCDTCGHLLEAGWTRCPGCGSEIPPEKREALHVKKSGDKGLKWVLAVVIAVPVILCALLAAGLIFLRAGYDESMSMGMVLMTQDEFSSLSEETRAWIETCDGTGRGVYVLEEVQQTGSRVKTAYLIYRNDGVYDAYPEVGPGGRLKPPSVQAQFTRQDPEGATLFYLEQSARKESSLRIFTDGVPTDYQLRGTEAIRLQDAVSHLHISVEIPAGIRSVYGVGCTLYGKEGAISEQGMEAANGDPLTGESVAFDFETNDLVGAEAFSLCIYDEQGQALAESDRIKLDGQTDYTFFAGQDAGGGTVLTR